ncbi:kti12, chromatin associated [Tilletia horrida]|nr:kti12, chromatin associated [Tilletia horrida]KAK0560610.1 kti12, chromatin associated [Tilletia horrida]
MALVIVSGLPCSGRSSVCASLRADFEARLAQPPTASGSSSSSTSTSTALLSPPRRILIVSDDTVHTSKSSYSAQVLEKPARASYLSAVSRALARDAIVFADGGAGLNIKGFRYQLWCAAREQGVRCVTLHVYASPEECKRRNAARRAADEEAYDDETIEDMLKRFEEPNAMTRWDSPLFPVKSHPPIAPGLATSSTVGAAGSTARGAQDDDGHPAIPYDDIWKAVTEAAPRKAPAVVVPHRQTTSNYLSALESVTQEIITHILSAQSLSSTIPIALPSSSRSATKLSLQLPPSAIERPLTISALQRLRRQFVKMHSTGLASGSEIASARDADTRALRGGAGQAGGGGPGGGGKGTDPSQSSSAVGSSNTEDEIARKFVGWLQQAL